MPEAPSALSSPVYIANCVSTSRPFSLSVIISKPTSLLWGDHYRTQLQPCKDESTCMPKVQVFSLQWGQCVVLPSHLSRFSDRHFMGSDPNCDWPVKAHCALVRTMQCIANSVGVADAPAAESSKRRCILRRPIEPASNRWAASPVGSYLNSGQSSTKAGFTANNLTG